MPDSIVATDAGDGTVAVAVDPAAAVVYHRGPETSTVPTSYTGTGGVSVVYPVFDPGYCVLSFVPPSPGSIGRLARNTTTWSNASLYAEVRLSGGSGAAKVRAIGGVNPSAWVDVTSNSDWVTVGYPYGSPGDLLPPYGLEVAALYPYGAGVSLELRDLAVVNYASSPWLQLRRRIAGGTPEDIDLPALAYPGLYQHLAAGSFTVTDGTVPLQVPVAYEMATSLASPVWVESDPVTIDLPGPLLSRYDVPEQSHQPAMVMSYSAAVAPQQSLQRRVAQDSPLLLPSAGSTRGGDLALFFTTWEAAADALATIGLGGRLLLREATHPGMSMVFAVERATLEPAPQSEGVPVPPWLIRASYQELTP